jgi:hypothetical protein
MRTNSLSQQLAQDDTLDEDFLGLVAGSQRPRPSKQRRGSDFKRKRAETMTPATPVEPMQNANWLPMDRGLDVTSTESEWVVEHLLRFYQTKIITRVLRRVKGGKEANVYCCAAHPDTGLEFIAAKIYRPRLMRALRNDAQYPGAPGAQRRRQCGRLARLAPAQGHRPGQQHRPRGGPDLVDRIRVPDHAAAAPGRRRRAAPSAPRRVRHPDGVPG